MNSNLIGKKLGIIGGGQLGKMLLAECNKMDISTYVLDSNDNSPCKSLCEKFYVGDLNDYETILSFGKKCDLITFEIEHINVDALYELEKNGKEVYPKPNTLDTIQDKNRQKCFFINNNIPTSKFNFFSSLEELRFSIKNNEISFPCVWKKTRFGYDGFGVQILKSTDDLLNLPETEMIIEEYIPFDKEISVIIARNNKGEVKCYHSVEMEFNKNSNQVEYVISPAKISRNLNEKAQNLSIEIAESIDLVGVMAVEMFLSDNSLLVNELAPRPHNSGHFSIEACKSSQFQQHLRSIFNLPLGETTHKGFAIMLNLVGDQGYSGKVFYENLEHVFNSKVANLHIYGKEETRPNRKMGHVTIICDKFEESYRIAKSLKDKIKVRTL